MQGDCGKRAWLAPLTVAAAGILSPAVAVCADPALAPGLDPSRWTPWAGLYLLLVLFLGVCANWLVHRRDADGPPRAGLDSRDLLAGVAVLAALALRLALLERAPISGDEASNLEIDFWGSWFLAAESRANPPLFRFLIHLTVGEPEQLWQLRLPAALFGALALWLFFRAARRRGGFGLALGLTVVLSLDVLQLDYSLEQKAYTLWLCLLLATHESFCSALSGRTRSWAGFALWSTLAVLTHYLTPLILLAHLGWVALRRRDRIRGLALGLAPAALALAVMAVPVLVYGADAVSTRDPTRSWLAHLVAQALVRTTVIGLGLMLLALPGAPARSRSHGDGALPWLVLAGLTGPLLIGLLTPVWSRYFYPLLPFGLLWLAGRLEPDLSLWSWRRRLLVGLGVGVVLLGGVVALIRHASATGSDPLLAAIEGENRAAVTLIHPAWNIDPVAFELTGRRGTWNNGCPGVTSAPALRRGERLVVGVSRTRGEADMERALQRVGCFDLLRYCSGDGRSSPAVDRWLARRCRVLAEVPVGSDGVHRAFHCEDGPARPIEGCEIFSGAAAQ